jgi:hypothetical protein
VTEEIAATPGWVEARLDSIFAELPDATRPARDAYAACLAARKSPGAPSDLLGAEFEGCRGALERALLGVGLDRAAIGRIDAALEALEAEIDAES